MRYEFQKLAELGWFVLVAVVAFVAQTIALWNFEDMIADWQTYVIALASGAGRVAVAALASALTKLFTH